MGYTHYWNRPKEIDLEVFAAITSDFSKIVKAVKAKGIKLGDMMGKKAPTLTPDLIGFNGLEPNDFESFHFPRVLEPEHYQRPENGLYFEFCKTARKPYDLAVTAFLVIVKQHLPNVIVSTDGGQEEWLEAENLCQSVLGYGAKYKVVREPGEGSFLRKEEHADHL